MNTTKRTEAFASVLFFWRKRRASVAHLRGLVRDASAVVVPALLRNGVEIDGERYARTRARKLTPNDIACIRMMDGTLREIAAEFGVSHELVRQIRLNQ